MFGAIGRELKLKPQMPDGAQTFKSNSKINH